MLPSATAVPCNAAIPVATDAVMAAAATTPVRRRLRRRVCLPRIEDPLFSARSVRTAWRSVPGFGLSGWPGERRGEGAAGPPHQGVGPFLRTTVTVFRDRRRNQSLISLKSPRINDRHML